MQITFIGHSGFLIETEQKYLLFDYFEGHIPTMKTDKTLYIFVSHAHGDHFNPSIFRFAETHGNVKYILSHDIKLKPRNLDRWGVSEKICDEILSVKAHQTYEVEDIRITTYKSTDQGVAFLLETEGKTIYHAGDLNWWLWEGETDQWNKNMTASFQKEIEKMTGLSLDLAFLPLDPRQEGNYYLGMGYMLKKVDIKHIIPMHMWEEYTIIDRFMGDGHLDGYNTELIKITGEGQVIDL